MNRILIVDDEHHIVNWIFQLCEESNQIEAEIYRAYSGTQALSILQETKADLILLDIQMPGMDGLETADNIMGLWPQCHIIFLTAYDNFDYIYQADKRPHTTFLLKTETDETILSVIKKELSLIRQEQETQQQLSLAAKREYLLHHLQQQNLLKEILTGKPLAQLTGLLALAGDSFVLDLSRPVYLLFLQVTHKSLGDYETSSSELTIRFLQLFDRLFCDRFRLSMLDLDLQGMLWFLQPLTDGPSRTEDFVIIHNTADDIMSLCRRLFSRTVNIILFPHPVPFDHVEQTFYRMLTYYSSLPKNQNIPSFSSIVDETSFVQKETTKTTVTASQERLLQELCYHLYQGNEAEYYRLLSMLSDDCRTQTSMHSLPTIQLYSSVSLMLIRYINENDLTKSLAMSIALYPLYYVYNFTNWTDAFSYLQRLSSQLFTLVSKTENARNIQTVNRITRYINEHISESLTLTKLAALVNYNESYVSRLFRQITGTTLSEYITNTRLKVAKHYLSTTGESIQKIASITGFDTSQYFSIVFKKNTGMSPREYRNLHEQEKT